MSNKGKTCRIDGHQVDISHKIWNEFYPDNKIHYGDGFDIHHKNGDHSDNSKKNLEKILHGKHTSLSNKNNKYHLGKHHLSETRKKMADSKKGHKYNLGKKNAAKAVTANFIKYPTRKEAAEALGITPFTIRYRILTNKPGYSYIQKEKHL